MKSTGLPLLLRLTAGRMPALLVGIIVSAVLTGLLALSLELEGYQLNLDTFWDSSYFIFTSGYVAFITRVIYQGHLKSLEQLLQHAEITEVQTQAYRIKMRETPLLLGETLVALAIGIFHSYMNVFDNVLAGTSTTPIYASWIGIQIILIWLLITHATAIAVRNMRTLNELSTHIKVDLLNMDKFVPLTRSGIVGILGFIGAYSLLFVQGYKNISFTDPAILALIPSIIWLVITPLKGVRNRVIKAKEEEIRLIDAAIEGDRGALKSSRIKANLDNINVIDLINYKKIIQNTLEIPVNLPTASRLLFYLIIPLLTWIASSIVDKSIDYIFG